MDNAVEEYQEKQHDSGRGSTSNSKKHRDKLKQWSQTESAGCALSKTDAPKEGTKGHKSVS